MIATTPQTNARTLIAGATIATRPPIISGGSKWGLLNFWRPTHTQGREMSAFWFVVLGFVVAGGVYAIGYRDGVRVGVARGEAQAARHQREAIEDRLNSWTYPDCDEPDLSVCAGCGCGARSAAANYDYMGVDGLPKKFISMSAEWLESCRDDGDPCALRPPHDRTVVGVLNKLDQGSGGRTVTVILDDCSIWAVSHDGVGTITWVEVR